MQAKIPLYTTSDFDDGCDCPIHRDRTPFVAPLGMRFEHDVHVEEIDKETAEEIYLAHHSYMGEVHDCNIVHHGIYYQSCLVGAMTYRAPLISRLKLGVTPDGGLTREYDESIGTFIVNGRELVEINRICIGIPMRNLASCALAASMDHFIANMEDHRDWQWLLTFIREDHVGSMLKALYKKGWSWVGMSEPRNPGNREVKEIHSWAKQRWVYPIYDYTDRIDAQTPTPTTSAIVADD